MASRIFAFVTGLIYAFFGAAGFVPAWVGPPSDRLQYQHIWVSSHYGWLFGVLPVNIVHDVVYLIIGAAGLGAALNPSWAKLFCRGVFGVTVLFVFLGLWPWAETWKLWGLMPLYGWNELLHALTAMLAWYFGWVYPLGAARERPAAAA